MAHRDRGLSTVQDLVAIGQKVQLRGAGVIEELVGGFSVEFASTADKYEISTFARDDMPRFLELVDYLSPRDAEIMLCFALLQKRPTDLSILFGKAGHRAEEDLHKAAHKLAGLIEFGPAPNAASIVKHLRSRCADAEILSARACRYAETRTFDAPGLRKQMLHAFKVLHASEGREEGLLAGWILWLVDGANPHGKGWKKRKARPSYHQPALGPTVFRQSANIPLAKYEGDRYTVGGRADQRGGRRQVKMQTKISRKMKFMLGGANA